MCEKLVERARERPARNEVGEVEGDRQVVWGLTGYPETWQEGRKPLEGFEQRNDMNYLP